MSSEKQMRRVCTLALGEHLEGVPHHARARDLAEGADVRQPRRPIAGLEDDGLVLAALELVEARDEPARLLERPGSGVGECGDWVSIGGRGHCGFHADLGELGADFPSADRAFAWRKLVRDPVRWKRDR